MKTGTCSRLKICRVSAENHCFVEVWKGSGGFCMRSVIRSYFEKQGSMFVDGLGSDDKIGEEVCNVSLVLIVGAIIFSRRNSNINIISWDFIGGVAVRI